ncbi:MAG: tetratricopeptide repeat protein [Cyclobacteriaceae bacterium]
MKRISVLMLAMAVCFVGYGQKKPKINSANKARENGDLVTAKSIIDEAIVHEKTKDDGKTWYYRGLIYATIDTASNEQISSLSDMAMEEAMKSFGKADEIDPDGKSYYTTAANGLPVLKGQQIDGYYSFYYNSAVNNFQEKNFEAAVKDFESAYYILPKDTNAYVNAAYAAHNGELYDLAIKNYRAAIDAGATSKDLYYNYFGILSTTGDKEGALDLVNEALEKFPMDNALSKNKINLLIELERIDEAKTDLLVAIEEEPDNPSLYFALAVLYEQTEEREKSIQAYKDALKVDPNHYESNFNYGVVLINEANEVIKESNSLGISKADLKKADELEPVINDKLKAALPQWEKVYEVRPEDKTAIETLAYIYTQLKMYDKAEKMRALLDSE